MKKEESRMKKEGSVRELLCNAIARNNTWDENVIATRKVQRTFEGKLMKKTARKLARESINNVRRFWDHYDK